MTLPNRALTFAMHLRWAGAALLLLCVGRAHAQNAAESVTLAAVGVPLQTALEALIDETRIALAYDNTLVAGRTAYCRVERVTVERALECVLERTGLDWARLSSGTYVLFHRPEATVVFGGVEGDIVDAATGAPLAGAHIVLASHPGATPAGAAANAAGRFALVRLFPGTHRLVVSHVGYRRAEITVRVESGATSRLRLALPQETVITLPIVVSGLASERLSSRLGEAVVSMDSSPDEAGIPDVATPTGAAMPDVTRALDAIVGVRVGEALSDVHLQGGGAGEHAFLLDGAPLLVPVSLGGLIGPFSPFGVSRVVVRKAGFPAEHGGALAGVIEVESLSGPPEDQALVVQADPLSANLRWSGRAGVEGRLEGTWAFAARQGLWNVVRPAPLADRLSEWSEPDRFLIEQLGQAAPPDTGAGFPVDLSFTDLHAAGRLRFGGLKSLHGSFYLARHAFAVEDVGPDDTPADELYEDAYRWGNLTGQLRYEWVQGARAFGRAGIWASGYDLRRPSILGDTAAADDFNALQSVGARTGLDIAATSKQWVSTTLELTSFDSDTGAGLPGTTGMVDQPLRWTVAGTVDDRIALGERASLTLGARLTWLPERQAVFTEPRVSLRFDGAPGVLGPWAVRVAAGRYLQFVTAVDVADGGPAPLLPQVRFWLPLAAGERPPEAYHLVTEAIVQPAEAWDIGAEAYLKHLPHLLVPDYVSTSGRPLAPAEGFASGVALRVERHTERLRLAAIYELAFAGIRTPGRFGDGTVPPPWHVPHSFRADVDATIVRHLTVTIRGQAALGRTWGFRQAYYDLLEPDSTRVPPFDLSEPGEHRLPAFVQVDLNVAYATVLAGVGVQARIGVLNALGRDNVRDWLLVADESGDSYSRHPRHAMPFLPVFALRLTR